MSMSRTLSCDSLVLATYNVGEADRFCVLFTKEYGRLAARASAARKIGSRLGAALLPFQRISAELREWNNGYVITGARRHPDCARTAELSWFLSASEIIELLLMLLEEGEPLPELFESVAEALLQPATSALPHTIRILHLLGHMPSVDMPHFSIFSAEEKICIEQWIGGKQKSIVLSSEAEKNLSALCESILSNHGGKKRHAADIRKEIMVSA